MQKDYKSVKCHYTEHEHRWWWDGLMYLTCEWCLIELERDEEIMEVFDEIRATVTFGHASNALAVMQDWLSELWLERNKPR